MFCQSDLVMENEIPKNGIPVLISDMEAWYECTKKPHFKIAMNKANKIIKSGSKPLLRWMGGNVIKVVDAKTVHPKFRHTSRPIRKRSIPIRKRHISQVKR